MIKPAVHRTDLYRLTWRFWLCSASAIVSGICLSAIEWLFVGAWFTTRSAYAVPAASFACTGLVILGLALEPRTRTVALRIAAFGAGALVLCVLMFLVQIEPIAQGNNDSGEVGALLLPPAVILFAYAFYSNSKLRNI